MLRLVNDLLQRRGLPLRTGAAVDATLIFAPSTTKNADGECGLEMKQTKKDNDWCFVVSEESIHVSTTRSEGHMSARLSRFTATQAEMVVTAAGDNRRDEAFRPLRAMARSSQRML